MMNKTAMVFVGLFFLMGSGVVSGKQIVPAPLASVGQPSGTPAASASKSTAPSTFAVPPGIHGPAGPNQTGPQSSGTDPAHSGASSVGDIRDIRGPIHIPDPLAWLPYGAAGLLLLLALAWFFRWFRKRKAERERLPFELALEQLEQAKAFMKPETAGRFSVLVSAAVRNYIETRFEMKVTKHTTEEFMRRVATESPGKMKGYEDLLNSFLGYCDLAKFARYVLTPKQMEEMLQSALQFVDATKPRPQDEKSGQIGEKKRKTAKEEIVQKSPSLLKRYWEKGLGFTVKRPEFSAALDKGGATAKGGK